MHNQSLDDRQVTVGFTPTDVDRQLMSLLARGASYALIGSELAVSERTARRRLSRLRTETQAKNSIELAAIAVRRGWI